MKNISRVLVFIAAAILIVTFFTPLWKIELSAPQYPEGLVMKIWTYKLGGDIEIINGLNHYIGMGTMHDEDFIEFKVLPYIIGFIMFLGMLTALLGNRKLLFAYTSFIVVFGIVAMVDFYIWEYEYGHNLDPSAPIQVPGMSYQPPLIGYKKLLNFGAYSIPDIGGWTFVFSGLLVFGVSVFEWKKNKVIEKPSAKSQNLAMSTVAIILLTTVSCSREPKPIIVGQDQCDFCKMTIMDTRFGSEIILTTGKPFKFDDISCAVSFMKNDYIESDKIYKTYVVDYSSGKLIDSEVALYLSSHLLKSPMGSNLAAFSNKDSLINLQSLKGGEQLLWAQVQKDCIKNKDALSNL